MDPIKTIGKLLNGPEERDCIHIAIMAAQATEDLRPGDEVGLAYGTTNQIRSMDSVYDLPAIGIVDPFYGLKKMVGDKWVKRWQVEKGQWCWVFLFPGSITGLRHNWTHPAIDNVQAPKNESEEWLRRFADKWNFDYSEMVYESQTEEGYVVARGIDLHSRDELAPGDEDLFWKHMEALTGKKFGEEHRLEFGWSCSC